MRRAYARRWLDPTRFDDPALVNALGYAAINQPRAYERDARYTEWRAAYREDVFERWRKSGAPRGTRLT